MPGSTQVRPHWRSVCTILHGGRTRARAKGMGHRAGQTPALGRNVRLVTPPVRCVAANPAKAGRAVQPAPREGPAATARGIVRQLPSDVHSFGWRAGDARLTAHRHWEGRSRYPGGVHPCDSRHPGPWVSRVKNASTGAEAASAHRQADGPSGGRHRCRRADPRAGTPTHVRNRLIVAVWPSWPAASRRGVPAGSTASAN